jgi:hypothetical protein
MSTDEWPLPDPRAAGMREHLARTTMFLEVARSTRDPVARFRFLIAGIYFARGIVELMFEAADKEQVSSNRDQLKHQLPRKLPWYALIERLRIHDFHRFGLTPPDAKMKVLFQGGPIKLRSRKGAAVYTITSQGPQAHVTGASSINEQRPLLGSDGKFFDEETKQCVSLEQILTDFAKAAPAVIEEFAKQMNG